MKMVKYWKPTPHRDWNSVQTKLIIVTFSIKLACQMAATELLWK